MRHSFLDRHSRLDSPIHRLPAGLKLAAALALVVAVVLQRPYHFAPPGAVGAVLLVVAGFSRVPAGFLAKRLLLLEPFVLGVALLALYQPGGWWLFCFLVAKSTACLFAMLLLSATTPFDALLRVLKTARLPALLVTTLSLMYRYQFVLVDEAGRMKRARLSRTLTPQRTWAWHGLATVVSQLFIRSSERAERIYAAMAARGWR